MPMATTTSDQPRQRAGTPAPAEPSPARPARLMDALFAPIDAGIVATFRIAFGASMLIEVLRYFAHGWIDSYFVDPPLHFTYFGFSWVRPLPGSGMHVLFGILGVCATLMMVGLFYRLAALVFCLGFTWVFLIEQSTYLNHFYLIVLLSIISVLLPANRFWSLDALWRPSLWSPTLPAWTLWLLRFQVGSAYFFGGVAKLNWDWLSGVPMQMMLAKRTDFPVIGQFFLYDWAAYFFAWGGLLLDLFVVPFLLWPKTRKYAFLAAVLFHLTNAKLFSIGIFPVIMLAATTLFFPPEWFRFEDEKPEPRKGKVGRTSKSAVSPSESPRVQLGFRSYIIVALLAVYCAFQVLMPLRHFLYPGDVSWTEEGHRFSWHMKLRLKSSDADFLATDASGRELTDLPRPQDVLTARQLRTFGGRPDMVLQYAHFLAAEARARGHEGVQVHVASKASLNGRRPQDLIDPQVDLAAQPRNLWPAPWIVPLTEPRPTLAEARAFVRNQMLGRSPFDEEG
jgi:hypothetical protein